MDSSLFLTIVAAAAISFFVIFRKFRSNQENKEFDPSSLSTSLVTPSSLSTSLVTPSSSSQNWTHDVFPSFRGEDVRRDFLSHIQKEFQRKAITSFNDNGIERGESIGPELIRAIRGSKIAIVLISKNYASSKWCLEELVEIMKCKEDLGQTVMAIFYKVDPSDVKKLTGYFGKVFKKTCEGKTKDDVRRWKQALEKVATIAGYHSCNWDNEADMIEKIATDVSNKLINSAELSHFDNLVGMSTHMENLEPFLRLGSNEVRMIGVWGPSGIGKSTIARVLFSQHFHQFQFSVFMENIKRRYPGPYYDEFTVKLQLQKEFLSQIINQEDIKIYHLQVVQDRLKDKRVLAVLDDLDHPLQLEAMAKEARWFGPGSRIIFTTQDKKLLNAHGVDHIYKVKFPPNDEALEIFCMNAFGQKSPYDGFMKLAREVTIIAGNLPLGLRVMGSYFKGMPKHEWEEELPRLRTRLDGEIESILKFSYDALCYEDQSLFLHIACFFNRVQIEKVEEYLAETFVGVKGRLRVLADKSFISFDCGTIRIHDLLARFGREVVRKQSIDKPWQRQFLVDYGDMCQVLRNDSVDSASAIGIDVYLEFRNKLKINDGTFEKMSNVQFFRLQSNLLPISHVLENWVTCLPPNLRFLHWSYFPMTCLPSNFNPEFLMEINLPQSNYLQKLWEGNKTITNLKWMYLRNCKNLKKLPDLSTATNLQGLILHGCSSLEELPFSIVNAINLKSLDLQRCTSLAELPFSIGNMTNLLELDLNGCTSMMELPSSIGNMIHLENLSLRSCLNLVELPSSVGNMTNLKKLYLDECSSLLELPSSIGNMTNLKKLNLNKCSSLVELPSSIWNMTNLEELHLFGCPSLVELPSSIGNMTNLKELHLDECPSLVELPSSIGNMANLKELYLFRCPSLVELPSSIGNMTNLKELHLDKCPSLVELPSSIGNMTNLKKLHLDKCPCLVELPSSIGNMTNLEELLLYRCPSLVELPSSIGNMTNLKDLILDGCSCLVKLPSSIGNMTNLRKLYLYRCSSLVELPSFIENMTNLRELSMCKCSSLVEIPSSIGNMTNLMKLSLYKCSSLGEFPSSIGNMTNLNWLSFDGCSILVELSFSIENMTNLRNLVRYECPSFVELPFSIGNMTNLNRLSLKGCSNLVELPSFIGNITSLKKLYLCGYSSLVELPSFIWNMTNLEKLLLDGLSSLVEIPSSIGNMTNLQELFFRKCSNLVELPSSIENMTNLQKLSFYKCSSLVKLQQLPDSLKSLCADNCECLERLDCSFYKTTLYELSFVECCKLNQEARDLIIKTSTRNSAVFPGETVPTYFTYRASGSSLSMKWNGFDTHFPTPLRLKVCLLLVNKGDVVADWRERVLSYCLIDKLNCLKFFGHLDLWLDLSQTSKEHLVVFEFEEIVSYPEVVFEFQFKHKKWEIEECGLRPLETLATSW